MIHWVKILDIIVMSMFYILAGMAYTQHKSIAFTVNFVIASTWLIVMVLNKENGKNDIHN